MASSSSTSLSVAERYASALFALAREHKVEQAVEDDLLRLDGLLDASEALKRLVFSPVFTRTEQERALLAILDNAQIGGLARNFCGLVARNRRLFALRDIIQAYKRLYAHARGEVSAEVTSAHALSQDHLRNLKATLKDSVGKDVDLTTHVDPSLLGGLVVKIGSRMIDTSLKSKLASLSVAMKGVG